MRYDKANPVFIDGNRKLKKSFLKKHKRGMTRQLRNFNFIFYEVFPNLY